MNIPSWKYFSLPSVPTWFNSHYYGLWDNILPKMNKRTYFIISLSVCYLLHRLLCGTLLFRRTPSVYLYSMRNIKKAPADQDLLYLVRYMWPLNWELILIQILHRTEVLFTSFLQFLRQKANKSERLDLKLIFKIIPETGVRPEERSFWYF